MSAIVDSFMELFLNILPLIISVAVGGVVIILLSVILKEESGNKYIPMPYEKRQFLLSKAENSFYQVLKYILGSSAHIYPKVRVADIVFVKKGTQNRLSAYNRIQSKHVDFLICDQRLKPILVIELDDKSHKTAKVQKNDRFKDELFKMVDLRLVRIKASSSYNTDEIKSFLMPPKKDIKQQPVSTTQL